MQPVLVSSALTQLFNNFFQHLEEKFPLEPLSAIRQNYLMMTQDGSDISRLESFSRTLYKFVKNLEMIPDEDTGAVIVHRNEKGEEVKVENYKPKSAINIIDLETPIVLSNADIADGPSIEINLAPKDD